MSEATGFAELWRRVRQGDADAAAELVRSYEPAIRREARMRLKDVACRRLLDSVDICQMALGSFFVRAAVGQFEVDTPGQLLGLLMRIVRNKVVNEVERERAQRRGGHIRKEGLAGPEGEQRALPALDATPSRLVAGKELLGLVMDHFTEEERLLAERRTAGCSWQEIAGDLGGTPDGRRVQYQRAVNRVARALNLDAENDEPV